jgi:trk system potassium uptake protein
MPGIDRRPAGDGSTRRRRRLASFLPFRHPAQLAVAAFAAVIAIGSLLLMLPVASTSPGRTPSVVAVFTATSAVCVTGLTVVDTPTAWTTFGQIVIATLIQLGGLGIMTAASLLALLVSRRLGLRSRLIAQAETKAFGLGEVRRVVFAVAAFSLFFEATAAIVIAIRLWVSHGYGIASAAYHGVFHAISAFNNAGFALFPDSIERFVIDPWMNLAIGVPVVFGALGLPVLRELRGNMRHPSRWSLHTKMTVAATAGVVTLGTGAILALEWSNPATLGSLSTVEKLLPGLFQGAASRTAGFSTIAVDATHETTWLVTSVLMFIGGGSASAAGGIKVTTFALLAAVIWAEARGEPSVTVFRRRVPVGAHRQALSVASLAIAVVVLGAVAVMVLGGSPLSRSLFETVSAFGTTGLSTGLAAELPGAGRMTLAVLMFLGRLGPITFATALALREKERRYTLPEERPIIG